MKKNLQLLTIALFTGSFVMAQNAQIQPCNTYNVMEEHFAANPGSKENYEKEQQKMQTEYLAYINSNTMAKTAAVQYTIPIVFHILHTYGSENIPDATVYSAVNSINSDFAKMGSDVSTISSLFSGLYINSDIKVMLARKDPNGNCTSGIVHHYDTHTQWYSNGSYASYFAYTWNPTKYLNVYIVKSICSSPSACSPSLVTVGYTLKPGSVGSGSPYDAIVFNANYLSGSPRSLTHEIGHWLNLSHVFGNTNNPGVTCGDDGISDTPPTKGNLSTCPPSSGGNTCSGSGGNTNIENIMDYSSCPKMFTTGQTNVMRAALASGTSGRNNLSTAANLLATDVNNTGDCAPIADLALLPNTVCSGGSLNFYDVSYNGTVTYRNWTGTGGAYATNPTGVSTSIVFPYPGIQTVSLTVGNSTGTTTVTRLITVINGNPNIDTSFVESFEAGVNPVNWTVIDPSGGVKWKITTPNAATGLYSYYLDNSINPNNAIDILETPSYNFASDPNSTFTFKYAYARKDAANNDVFKVQASKDCGGTWTDIWVPNNGTLASGSGGVTNTPFFPTPSQFKTYTLTNHPAFGPFKLEPNVRIRFYFQEDATAGFGNNIFLDDINYHDSTASVIGINELTKYLAFNLFPNPTPGTATVEFTLSNNSSVNYFITDVTGRIVEQEKSLNLTPGTHKFTMNESRKLTTGVYFVNFGFDGQRVVRKLIIE